MPSVYGALQPLSMVTLSLTSPLGFTPRLARMAAGWAGGVGGGQCHVAPYLLPLHKQFPSPHSGTEKCKRSPVYQQRNWMPTGVTARQIAGVNPVWPSLGPCEQCLDHLGCPPEACCMHFGGPSGPARLSCHLEPVSAARLPPSPKQLVSFR